MSRPPFLDKLFDELSLPSAFSLVNLPFSSSGEESPVLRLRPSRFPRLTMSPWYVREATFTGLELTMFVV